MAEARQRRHCRAYEIVLRIHRAQTLVVTLGKVSDHRPPSIVPMRCRCWTSPLHRR